MTIQLLSNTLSIYVNGVVKKKKSHFPPKEKAQIIFGFIFMLFSLLTSSGQ